MKLIGGPGAGGHAVGVHEVRRVVQSDERVVLPDRSGRARRKRAEPADVHQNVANGLRRLRQEDVVFDLRAVGLDRIERPIGSGAVVDPRRLDRVGGQRDERVTKRWVLRNDVIGADDVSNATHEDASVGHCVVVEVHRGRPGADPGPARVELVVRDFGAVLLDADYVRSHVGIVLNIVTVEGVVHHQDVAVGPLRPPEPDFDQLLLEPRDRRCTQVFVAGVGDPAQSVRKPKGRIGGSVEHVVVDGEVKVFDGYPVTLFVDVRDRQAVARRQ